MIRAQRSVLLLMLSLTAVSLLNAAQPNAVEVAGLHSSSQLVWQRVRSAGTGGGLEGPVLYTIIIRSSATPNNIPKISNNYTLANSLITDTGTAVMIGGANGLVRTACPSSAIRAGVAGNLSTLHCTAVDCSTHGPVTVLDSRANAGQSTSVTIGTDGLPIISYTGFSGNPNLSVVHCANVLCAPPFVRRR